MTRFLISVAMSTVLLTPAAAAQQTRNHPKFHQMLSDTGCNSRFSDEKKADLFAERYQGLTLTVTGEIKSNSKGVVGLKVLSETWTSDVLVAMNDPKVAYDLEKGQHITVSFKVLKHGGCFLAYSGNDGVILK
jgi:hypothetical protein